MKRKRRKSVNLKDVVLRARLHRALNGGMRMKSRKISAGEKLFIYWLTPGLPPPGPFG